MRVLVFDSGVGGLSVVDCLRSIGSGITVDYAADAGFFPYGLKSDDELRARLPDICEAFVKAAEADLLVIACNTASTLALDNVRARLTIPVVGTVPAIKPAPCSWRVNMSLIVDVRSDSNKSRFSSPGIPKIYSTPSASRALTNKSDAFIAHILHAV